MTARRKIAAFTMSLGLALTLTGATVYAADATSKPVAPGPAMSPKPATPTPIPPTTTGAAAGPVYREFVLGKPNAKVTVIEYASLTCPHCAHFEQDDYPKLKKDYIDTGKIKYIYRDFPLDGLGAAAALLARCAPGDKGPQMIETLFKDQLKWIQAEKPVEPLKEIAKTYGIGEDDFNACLKNQTILDTIRSVQETASNLYHVEATPTFLIGDDTVAGADYDKLTETIDNQLKTKTK